MPYKKLRGLFAEIEPLQKTLEMRGGAGLDAPALNETRNATWHLLCALDAVDNFQRDDQIKKSERHAQRAIYDCREALLLSELDEFRSFDKTYENIPITPILSNYLNIKTEVENAIILIEQARQEHGAQRENFYQELKEPLASIRKNNLLCATAREELNKYIVSENTSKQKETRDRKIIVVTIAIAIFTLVAALLAVPQFNESIFAKQKADATSSTSSKGN